MTRRTGWVAVTGLALLASAVHGGPAALDLRLAYTPGDEVLTERVISTDMTDVSTENGDIASTSRGRRTNRYVYLQTYLAVWPDGRPQTVRRTYRVATSTRASAGHAPVTVVSPLQGKTVTVTNRQGIAEVNSPAGLEADDTESLYQALTDDFERMVLTGEHKLGDTWSPPPHVDLVIVIHATCTGTARLDRMVQYGGMRCARITMTNVVSGVSQTGAEVTKEGPTVVHWSPGLRRPLSASTRGTLRIHQVTNQGATIVDTRSEGTLNVDRRLTWIRVAGKRVGAPPPAGGSRKLR